MDNPELLKDDRRKQRICEGSGCPPPVIMYVINEQKNWADMIKRMDPMALRVLTQEEKPKFANERQFREQLQNVAKAMSPQMLRSMGGMAGLEASLRQSWETKR